MIDNTITIQNAAAKTLIKLYVILVTVFRLKSYTPNYDTV